jgi:hypothetical protein
MVERRRLRSSSCFSVSSGIASSLRGVVDDFVALGELMQPVVERGVALIRQGNYALRHRTVAVDADTA